MRFLDTSQIRTRFDQRVRAADGTELSVDLYLPAQAGCYPVLLNRTAADNNRAGRAGVSIAPAERWKAFAAQGFIVAAADARGRGDSGGRFVPFVNEAADGAATLAWLRKLDEGNGRIGVFGTGYGAFCAWAAAVADGAVGAVASISPFGSVGKGLVHRGGAVRLEWLFWMHLIGGRTVQPANVPPWPQIQRHLPLRDMAEALGRDDIWWREWLAHVDPDDPLWEPLKLGHAIEKLPVTALHVTGWWDGQLNAAHDYYQAACRGGGAQRLIIGPWDSSATRRPVREVGGFDFGPRSVLDVDELLVEFFKAELRVATQAVRSAVRVFVTGRNEWVDCENWPEKAAKSLQLYLSSTMGANTRRGDGALSATEPEHAGADSITHNPALPVEFQPHFTSFAAGANSQGLVLDQAHITCRDEALVYTSAPLERSLVVLGRPTVTLCVTIEACDADLYVLLSDSFPLDMRDLHLSHAAIRLATLDSFRPGEPVQVELPLDTIAHHFLPGHRVRLTLVPSLFPLYARNAHSNSYADARELASATLELRWGPVGRAALTLPLVGADADSPP